MIRFKTHGKWILAGEHSVLRGGSALVFPVQSRCLDFIYIERDQPLSVEINHENQDLERAFWGVMEKALSDLNLPADSIRGELKLTSNIPVGAGMGASATLCVSLARWFEALGHLPSNSLYEFATGLENLFHGKSSGVDVAVSLHNKALNFKMPNHIEPFTPAWEPEFYLSYSGKRGVTADCIKKVQSLISKDPQKGEEIDQQMQRAVAMAQQALDKPDQQHLLIKSLETASDCFLKWGLIGVDLREHMDFLSSQGALATKPTGSGEGGFVLSLWNKGEIPSSLDSLLIKA